MDRDLTQGSVMGNLLRFSLPYLLSCFLQTFYGLADLFIIGQYNGAAVITAVSVGSQVTHMLTVVIVGLAMGGTVAISRAVGKRDFDEMGRSVGNTVLLFAVCAVVLTAGLLMGTRGILTMLDVPEEAWVEAGRYLTVCFWGVPFITAYNVLSCVFRGLGDSRRPMYFVAVAGVVNVGLDYLLVGAFGMGAAGAALATIASQGLSVAMALVYVVHNKILTLRRSDFRADRALMGRLLRVGVPVAAQDGLVQVAFLVITAIANGRGVNVAAAVGIVEKVISFFFMVPSAMLSSVSAIAAQNAGAEKHDRSHATLRYAVLISVGVGVVLPVFCQFRAESIVRLFSQGEPEVVLLGGQYLRAYSFDCIFAGVHFCFSGYFCAYQKSLLSFAHNLASILLVRIPGAYLASVRFPDSLFPMGLAAPLGSLFSAVICFAAYRILRRQPNGLP